LRDAADDALDDDVELRLFLIIRRRDELDAAIGNQGVNLVQIAVGAVRIVNSDGMAP
jgi:hypothetical protein